MGLQTGWTLPAYNIAAMARPYLDSKYSIYPVRLQHGPGPCEWPVDSLLTNFGFTDNLGWTP